MSDGRIPHTVNIKPWFKDHYFNGKVVLPAVETMLLLAAHVARLYPEVDVRVMENGRFAKFLEIPSEAATVCVLVECNGDADGRVQAKLLSRRQFKSISRITEHCTIFFSPIKNNNQSGLEFQSVPPATAINEINTEQVYRELVPFGPNYQTLQETLYLSLNEAWGKLKAPDFL